MAHISVVKSGLDEVSAKIAAIRKRTRGAIDVIDGSAAALAAIPSAHAELIAEIGEYSTPGPPDGSFEELAVDELALLISEYQTLKAEVDSVASTIQGLFLTEF